MSVFFQFLAFFIATSTTFKALGYDTQLITDKKSCPMVKTHTLSDHAWHRALVVSHYKDNIAFHWCGLNSDELSDSFKGCRLYFHGKMSKLCSEEKFDRRALKSFEKAGDAAFILKTAGVGMLVGSAASDVLVEISRDKMEEMLKKYLQLNLSKSLLGKKCPRLEFIKKLFIKPIDIKSLPGFKDFDYSDEYGRLLVEAMLITELDRIQKQDLLLTGPLGTVSFVSSIVDAFSTPEKFAETRHTVIGRLLSHFEQMGSEQSNDENLPRFFRHKVTKGKETEYIVPKALLKIIQDTRHSQKFCSLFDIDSSTTPVTPAASIESSSGQVD